MSDLLSVIVPVYNTKAYLNECFISLLNQNYRDIEIIIIDDGSTDGSAELCDEYAKREKRISVYHQQNKGVSSARNLGLEKSHGVYVGFMDSDDHILPNIYAEMISSLKNNDVGLAVSSYTYWYPSDGNKMIDFTHNTQGVVDSNEALYEMLLPYGYRGYLFNKVFIKDVIHNSDLRFNTELKMMEDLDFVTRYLVHIEKVYFSSRSYYLYRMRSDSASHILNRQEYIKTFETLIPYIQDHYSDKCIEMIRWVYYAALLAYAHENMRKNKELFNDCLHKIQKERVFFLNHRRYSMLGYLRKILDELILRYML